MAEAGLERLEPLVGIEIALAGEAQRRRVEGDLDPGPGRDRPPAVRAFGGERDDPAGERFGPQTDPSAQAAGPGDRPFLDLEQEVVALPGEPARADPEARGVAGDGRQAPFGHRPMVAAREVEGQVDGAVPFGRRAAEPPGEGVIGREDRAEEDDRDEGEAAVVAQRIEIPPAIATGREGRVEARSASTARAACRPERIAIGTPGPGWTVPPAQ